MARDVSRKAGRDLAAQTGWQAIWAVADQPQPGPELRTAESVLEIAKPAEPSACTARSVWEISLQAGSETTAFNFGTSKVFWAVHRRWPTFKMTS